MSDEVKPDDGYTEVETIYAGRRLNRTGKPFLVFMIQGDDRASFDSAKALRDFRHAVIGGIYRHHRKAETFRLSTTYAGASKDVRVPEWQAADDACEVEIRARKLFEKDRTEAKASITQALAPFVREYRKTDRFGKLALEVVLLAALRNTRPGDEF